jgi:5'-nucleotidase
MTQVSGPTLLLTNDDGVDEPGLAALVRAAGPRGACRVVAPAGPQSSCGHAVTTGRPIRCEARRPGWTAVDGTPADCVRLGLHHLAPGSEWVLAGINAGGNLGTDILHSGTVAAVREGVLHGRPGIAFSHYHARGRAFDWERAAGWAARVLDLLLARPPAEGAFWNVNFPHPGPDAPEPEVVFCPVDPSPLPLLYAVAGDDATYNGDYHERRRVPGADVAVCFGGNIAVSLVPVWPGGEAPAEDAPGRTGRPKS